MNPLSPNNDQNLISSGNVSASLIRKIRRIKNMMANYVGPQGVGGG